MKPHLKEGAGQSPQFRLFLCLYRWLSRHFSPFYSPHPKSPVPACWVVGRVLLKFLLIITPKARIILVIFRGKHKKNDAELFLTIT